MTSGLRWNEAYGDVSDVVQMLFLEPEYVFKQRKSNFHNFSYNDQQVIIRGSLLF